MIGIGVLGAAKIAPKGIIWPANNRDDCEIIGVASRDPVRAKLFAETHRIPQVFENYTDLINAPNIDLIYNALPPNRHADLTISALKANKSVLCEKPFAMNAREASAMVAAAKSSKGHLIEGFHYFFHPAVQDFLTLIHSGKIGKIETIEGYFNVSIANKPGELRYRPELGGGALMDLGCYVLHFMRHICEAEPNVKNAEAIHTTSGVDVALSSDLVFSDIHAHLQCNMAEGTEREISLSVKGTLGTAKFDGFVHPYRDFSIQVKTMDIQETITRKDNEAAYSRSTYDYQLDHVVDVLNGKANPITGGHDAIKTMTAIDRIYTKAGFKR